MTPTEVVKEWERCFNERDAEGLAALYHEDAFNLQIAVGTPLVGRAAILDDAKTFFSNIPDNYTTVFNLIADGAKVAIEWRGGGTFMPTQQAFQFQGCGFFHVEDGKIRSQRGYWDMNQWMSAIGASKSSP